MQPETSNFNKDAWRNLKQLVEEAAEKGTLGTVTDNKLTGTPQAGVVYDYRFDFPIGSRREVKPSGKEIVKPLYRIRVVVDANNHVTTAFPR